MGPPAEVRTNDKKYANVFEGIKGQGFISNRLPNRDRTVCHQQACASGSECIKSADSMLLMWKYTNFQPPAQTNETWSLLKQWFLETVG
jgi:hypothetical protein